MVAIRPRVSADSVTQRKTRLPAITWNSHWIEFTSQHCSSSGTPAFVAMVTWTEKGRQSGVLRRRAREIAGLTLQDNRIRCKIVCHALKTPLTYSGVVAGYCYLNS